MRHHYLYALFSASDFSEHAQQYAFAQDIYLMPLRRSAFFSPVIDAIEDVTRPGGVNVSTLGEVRTAFRRRLLLGTPWPNHLSDWSELLQPVEEAARHQGLGFIVMFGGRFPAFLVGQPGHVYEQASLQVRIRWLQGSWFIEDLAGSPIFSFDLPEELFKLYERGGSLTQAEVFRMKGEMMKEFYAIRDSEGRLDLLQFKLDAEWYEEVNDALYGQMRPAR